jgi:hypothetical protein
VIAQHGEGDDVAGAQAECLELELGLGLHPAGEVDQQRRGQMLRRPDNGQVIHLSRLLE